jgi:hypothetical protein
MKRIFAQRDLFSYCEVDKSPTIRIVTRSHYFSADNNAFEALAASSAAFAIEIKWRLKGKVLGWDEDTFLGPISIRSSTYVIYSYREM